MRFLIIIIKSSNNFIFKIYNGILFFIFKVDIKPGWKVRGFIYILNHGKICIGEKFKANSSKYSNPIGGDSNLNMVVRQGASLNIGDNTGISNSTIVCWNSISIGNHVLIGGNCKIWDTDFHSLDAVIRTGDNDNQIKTSPIVIKDYVFIGSGTVILKGVTIGENTIVGAGSVVTKNIPENEIWAGNPACFIKRNKK